MCYGASVDPRFTETVEEFVALLADLGLTHVELRGEYLDVHPAAPTPREPRELVDSTDITYTFHAPYRDAHPGNRTESLRRATTDAVKRTFAAGAGGVVVHDGSVPRRYPDWVRAHAREQAVQSLREWHSTPTTSGCTSASRTSAGSRTECDTRRRPTGWVRSSTGSAATRSTAV